MVGAAFYTCLLTLVVHCNAFKSSSQLGRSSLPRLFATEIVIFGPNNMRIHDNPCLLSTEGKSIIPVVFSPINGDRGLQLAALSLTNKLKRMGANVVELSSDNKESLNEFSQFIQGLEIDSSTAGSHVSVTYCNSAVEPAASSIRGLVDHLSYESNVKCVGLWDEIVTFKDGEITTSNLHFDDFTEQYKPYSLDVPKPIMQQNTKFNKKISSMKIESITMEVENVPITSQKCSEETALELLTEYLSIGDSAFTNKYASTYASIFSKSKEHEESISRLKSMISEVDNKTKGNNFFQGEILSAVLAPMLTLGCLSPRLLIHAKNILLKDKKASSPEFPFVDRIRQEAVRRDWHQQLARASQPSVPLELKIQREIDLEEKGIWDVKYHNWRGYIQREGVMRGDNKQENRLKKKPLAFVLHGKKPAVFILSFDVI
jgi:deoxyribodipyrimidine photolyase